MNLKVRHKVGGGMSIDGQVADQLTFKEDGSLGTAHVPDLTTATDDTLLPWGLVKGLRSLPLFFRDIHFGTRESIATVFNGTARPNDGDEVYAETHPQVVLGILSGAQVSCLESEWQADPYKRGMWSRGTAALVDGKPTGWVRMPDMNQAKAGSLPPPFVRGGVDAKVGDIGKDTTRNVTGRVGSMVATGTDGPFVSSSAAWYIGRTGGDAITGVTFDLSKGLPEGHTGTEFAPWHLYGVSYSVIANGVMNEANINAAGLSAMLDVAYAKIAALQNDIGFTIIYPNGGTAAAPATVSINSRYVSSNPFPGSSVLLLAELRVSGKWMNAGWIYTSSDASLGVLAHDYDGSIVVVTGSQGLTSRPNRAGTPDNTIADNITAATPCRVKVWKVRGSAA